MKRGMWRWNPKTRTKTFQEETKPHIRKVGGVWFCMGSTELVFSSGETPKKAYEAYDKEWNSYIKWRRA